MKFIFSILILSIATMSFAGPEPSEQGHELEFNSESLQKSIMIEVAGKKVPMMVVTEIQKVCEQKGLSIEECNKLVEQGCVEFMRVYEDKNVQVTEVPVLVTVKLHIHERIHTIHQSQKRFTYHYDIKVIRSQSETHEFKELAPIHEPGTYSFNEDDLEESPVCPVAPPKNYTPSAPKEQFRPGGAVQTRQALVYRFWLPTCSRLTHDIARFVQSRRLNCQIYSRGSWVEFIGPEARNIGAIIVKYFPNEFYFKSATYPAVQALFAELEYFY